jgi:hypothetical protein
VKTFANDISSISIIFPYRKAVCWSNRALISSNKIIAIHNMTSVPEITSTIIDFSTTALGSSYPEAYAQILDNVFNAEECAALLQIAENSNSGAWESAGIGPRQSVVTEVRHSDRILCDDPDIAGIIFDRIHQLIPPEILCIEPCGKYSGIIPGQYHKFTWNAKRSPRSHY